MSGRHKEKRGGTGNEAFAGCEKNKRCAPAPGSCFVPDARKQFPSLTVEPWPEPDPGNEEEHRLWRRQYWEWSEICRCPCGKGYFCRRHGKWVRGNEAQDEYQRERDMFGYGDCPPSHHSPDAAHGNEEDTGLEYALGTVNLDANEGSADGYSRRFSAPDPNQAHASEKHHRSSKRAPTGRKQQPVASSSTKSGTKSKAKGRAGKVDATQTWQWGSAYGTGYVDNAQAQFDQNYTQDQSQEIAYPSYDTSQGWVPDSDEPYQHFDHEN